MLIKISEAHAINPKQVSCVMRDKKNLQTFVFIMGVPSGLPSDHDFEATIKLLNGEGNE